MPSHSCCTSTHSAFISLAEGLGEIDLEALQFVVLVDEVEGRIGALDGDADRWPGCLGTMPAKRARPRRRAVRHSSSLGQKRSPFTTIQSVSYRSDIRRKPAPVN